MERQQKVLQVEHFLNDVLKEDLKEIEEKRIRVADEINEYELLQCSIETTRKVGLVEKEGMKFQMDLGCHFFMEAHVADMSSILVNIGADCFLEMSPNEALKFVQQKKSQLGGMLNVLANDSYRVKAQIKMVLGGLQQLQGIQN